MTIKKSSRQNMPHADARDAVLLACGLRYERMHVTVSLRIAMNGGWR